MAVLSFRVQRKCLLIKLMCAIEWINCKIFLRWQQLPEYIKWATLTFVWMLSLQVNLVKRTHKKISNFCCKQKKKKTLTIFYFSLHFIHTQFKQCQPWKTLVVNLLVVFKHIWNHLEKYSYFTNDKSSC